MTSPTRTAANSFPFKSVIVVIVVLALLETACGLTHGITENFPSAVDACFHVFPCVVACRFELSKFFIDCLLIGPQLFDLFIVIQLRIRFGVIGFGLQLVDFGIPLVQLRLKFSFVGFLHAHDLSPFSFGLTLTGHMRSADGRADTAHEWFQSKAS